MHFLLPFFKWAETLSVSVAIRGSKWLFPAIEGVHIIALAVLFGTILVLDLRLFGITLRTKPVNQLAYQLQPFTLVSLVIILTSGFLLYASEAMKCYASVPFQVKMLFLFAALIFHFTAYSRVMKADAANATPPWGRLAAIVSVLLWLGVGIGGRGIGFL
jgi:hypothetical protein